MLTSPLEDGEEGGVEGNGGAERERDMGKLAQAQSEDQRSAKPRRRRSASLEQHPPSPSCALSSVETISLLL